MWTSMMEGYAITALVMLAVAVYLAPPIVWSIWQIYAGDKLECMQVPGAAAMDSTTVEAEAEFVAVDAQENVAAKVRSATPSSAVA